MSTPGHAVSLEEQIDQWRKSFRPGRAGQSAGVAELENRLRVQVASLVDLGLTTDEAFLVAVRRVGSVDAPSRQFARTDAIVAFSLAVAAAVVIKVVPIFGPQMNEDNVGFYVRNMSLFVLPL